MVISVKDKLIIIGAGPHAKVITDILQQSGQYEIVGLIDGLDKEGFLGLKVIGDDNCLKMLFQQGVSKAFIAIGSNRIRKRLFEIAQGIGFEIINAISKNAIISPYVKLGSGIAVMPGAVINVDTVIGDGCIVNTNSSIDHDGRIGNFVHVAPGTSIAGNVSLGDETFCGVGCRIIDGIKIGRNVMVGAGAVVISDIEPDCTIVGVPAKYIKKDIPF